MSEHSTLCINNYEVETFQNSIGWACELFTENDFIESVQLYEEDDAPSPVYQYVTTAANLTDRLEVLGFTLKRVQRVFEEGKIQVIKKAEELHSEFGFTDSENTWETPPFAPSKILTEFYSNYTFEYWVKLINKVLTRKLRRFSIYRNSHKSRQEKIKKQNPHLYHILERQEDLPFGFPAFDPFCLYRGMLEAIKPNTSVVLDFSNLVGFVEQYNYMCEPPKTIILTEGSSDKRILEESLQILYPHLFDYFSFIDFDLANMPGSTGHLLNIIKAFVATGVERKTIALFDNDTAGLDALRQLANVPLPENMRIISLPNLDFAKKYPTIGPQGQIDIDINGLACSIELYLGQNILVDENKKFMPIRWGGYMAGAKKYHGEITNKSKIQNEYIKLLSKIRANSKLIKKHDWSGIHSIFQNIFDAFNE